MAAPARFRGLPPEPAHNPALRIISADANGLEGPLSRIVINGDATILKEEAEGWPTGQRVSEGVDQIALGGDFGELGLSPGMECLNLGLGVQLTRGKACLCALAGDLRLDVVDGANAVQRFAGDLRFGPDPQVMEVAA